MKIDSRGHSVYIPLVKAALKREIKIWQKLYTDTPNLMKDFFSNPYYSDSKCEVCGECLKYNTIDQGKTFIANSECIYKNGFPPIEALLEVPSGEILLFNDFRETYEKERKYFNINNTLGIKKFTEHYTAQGLIMHFVGNTSPEVFQISDERLEIGNFYCEDEKCCELPKCPMPTCKMASKIASKIGFICTDLWWYSAVDRSEFENRIGKTVDQYEKEYHARGAWPNIVRAKVTPGIYKTVGQYHINSNLYSYIEKVK